MDLEVNGVREEAYQQRQVLMQSALSSMSQLRSHLISTLTGGALVRETYVEPPPPFLMTRSAPVATSPRRLTSPLPRASANSPGGGAARAASSRGGLGATSPPLRVVGSVEIGPRPATSFAEELVTRLQTPTLSSIRNARGGVRLLRGLHTASSAGQHSPTPSSPSSPWLDEAGPMVYTTQYTSNVPALSSIVPPFQPPARPGASFSMLSRDGRSKSPPLQMVRSYSTPAAPGIKMNRSTL